MGFIWGAPITTGIGLEPVCNLTVPPLVDVPCSSAMFFKPLAVILDLDLVEVLRTLFDKLALFLFLSQTWDFPCPI